jgi:hypothetical protein
MSSIGGLGPKVSKDIVITANFIIENIFLAQFNISYKMISNSTFLADLVLRKTIFYK